MGGPLQVSEPLLYFGACREHVFPSCTYNLRQLHAKVGVDILGLGGVEDNVLSDLGIAGHGEGRVMVMFG
jgi:hypothetical protein